MSPARDVSVSSSRWCSAIRMRSIVVIMLIVASMILVDSVKMIKGWTFLLAGRALSRHTAPLKCTGQRVSATTRSAAQSSFVTLTEMDVTQGHEDAFLVASLENARKSMLEESVTRFEVLRSISTPSRFVFVGVYRRPDGPEAHLNSKNYAEWYAATTGKIASYKTTRWDSIYPASPSDFETDVLVLERSFPTERDFSVDMMHVSINVLPGCEDTFIQVTTDLLKATLSDYTNSCLRYCFLRSVDNPRNFMLVPVFQNSEAAASAKKEDYYKVWCGNVRGGLDGRGIGTKYRICYPNYDAAWWFKGRKR